MKKFLLWSFERGSFQYDIICAVIIAFIALTPSTFFNDRPEHTIVTIRMDPAIFGSAGLSEQAALDRLRETLDGSYTVSRLQPVYDTAGRLVAYSIWIER